MLTLVTQFKLLFGRLGEEGQRLIVGFRNTLPVEKQAEFDTAQARMAGGAALSAARKDSAAKGSGNSKGVGGAAAARKSMPTDPKKLAKIQKILKITEEQLQRLPANAAAQIRATQAQYRVDGPSKKRLLHSSSGKHTVNIERLPGYEANKEADAADAAYAAATRAQQSMDGASADATAGAGFAVHDGDSNEGSPSSAQPRQTQHTKRAKTDEEGWGQDPPAGMSSATAKKTCPHCMGSTIAPFSAPCGHIACYSCWKEITNRGSVNGQFPCAEKSCSKTIRKKQLRKCHF